jgi:hypothetical protein
MMRRETALWLGAGTAILLAVVFVVLHFRKDDDVAARIAAKANRAEHVSRMQVALEAASRAEKNTLLARTDDDARRFADESRAKAALVDQLRAELEPLLAAGGFSRETQLLAQFAASFAELRKIDAQLLDLAVENSNVKAQALAFGPATVEVQKLHAALGRIADEGARQPYDCETRRLALDARGETWKVLALLPPHVAEESDSRMDELEESMSAAEWQVRDDLASLANKVAAGDPDFETARASFARFEETKAKILALSRANTNVRSLALSLHEKLRITMVCEDALAALERAIADEPVPGLATPTNPRRE